MPNAVRTSGDENPKRALNPATVTATRTSAMIRTSGDTAEHRITRRALPPASAGWPRGRAAGFRRRGAPRRTAGGAGGLEQPQVARGDLGEDDPRPARRARRCAPTSTPSPAESQISSEPTCRRGPPRPRRHRPARSRAPARPWRRAGRRARPPPRAGSPVSPARVHPLSIPLPSICPPPRSRCVTTRCGSDARERVSVAPAAAQRRALPDVTD